MTTPDERKHGKLIELLRQLMDVEEWEKAYYVGEHLSTLLPDDPVVYRAMGISLLHLGDLDRSETCLQKALGPGDGDPELLLLIAKIHHYRGNVQHQIFWLTKARERDTDNPRIAFQLAVASMDIGDREQAEEILNGIVRDHPDHIHARRALADLCVSQGRLAEAEGQLREALRVRSDIPLLFTELGHVLNHQGKHTDALTCFFRALDLNTGNPDRYYDIGDTYLALNEPSEAVPYLRRAEEANPFNPAVQSDLALAYFRLGRYREAAAAGRAALGYDPAMKAGRTNLGLAYMHLQQYADAEACFRKNLVLIAPTYFNLGLCQYRQEKYEEARDNFQRAVDLSPGDAEYRDMLANAYLELGRPDEAKAELERAIADDPTHCRAHYDLGVVFSRMNGQDDRAMELFERAIELDGSEWLPYYAIACIHAKRNRKELALNYLGEAVGRGFADREYLDRDRDWDGLREAPDFLRIRGGIIQG